jgi:hypothetical protein
MPDSFDLRTIKCFDGLHYSFETLIYIYESMHEMCTKIKDDQSFLIPVLWRCWSFIDIVNRIREISQAFPKLNKKNRQLMNFLEATSIAEEYRHYIQHLREELSKKAINPFPVWGSLAWVDPNDSKSSYVIFIGAQIKGTSVTGCVYDLVERKWVSKVCLGIAGKSFNFDPIYNSCMQFQKFIIPWILSANKSTIQIKEELPIITIQLLEQNDFQRMKNNL